VEVNSPGFPESCGGKMDEDEADELHSWLQGEGITGPVAQLLVDELVDLDVLRERVEKLEAELAKMRGGE